MTKYLSIAILLTSFLAGNAYGEGEVYYCAETDNNGFGFDENLKKYKRSGFQTSKFKIKFDRIAKTVEIKGHWVNPANGTYPCKVPWSASPEQLSCVQHFYHFSFNSNNGRFVFAMLFGYFGGDLDTISVSYGKCDKF